MIRLDLSTVIFIYLTIPLIYLFFSWFYYDVWKKVSNFGRQKKYVFQCTICTYSYIITANLKISKCPRCGALDDVHIDDLNRNLGV